ADFHLLISDGFLTFCRDDKRLVPEEPFWERWDRDALPVLEKHREAVMARWPKTRKNTAGYALDRFYTSGQPIDLLIGSEGTLGVVCESIIHLQPIPAHRASIRAALGSRATLAAAVAALEPHRPTSIEFLDRTLLR